jgi:transglutaminase-like putative cysteine protease
MRLRVVHQTDYEYKELVTSSYHEVHLTPRDAPDQIRLSHTLEITPTPNAVRNRIDYFKNQVGHFSLHQPHRALQIVARSEVRVDELRQSLLPLYGPAWEHVRDLVARDRRADLLNAYEYTFDSRYIPIDESLREYALPSFGHRRPLLDAARDLTSRIHAEFVYDPNATQVSTPLADVLKHRRGVCQDFAHLAIGCLRSLALPARYVSGYLLTTPPPGEPRRVGADASHAWVSVFCPGSNWVDFDPANGVMPSGQYITLAHGRDFGDVTPVGGVVVGGGRHVLRVSVDVARADEAA